MIVIRPMPLRRTALPLALLFVLLSLVLIPSTTVSAATFNPGCSVSQLVADVATAGSNGQADTINLAAGCTYTLTSTLTINGDSGNLLTINGNGATISGGSSVQVINVASGAYVSMNSLTITGGSATHGGGINNNGSLELTNVSIIANVVTGNGAGIYNNQGSSLTLITSTISGNIAGGDGGGIRSNNSSVTLWHTTISGNTAATGAGIRNFGTLTVTNSTISGNSANFNGGGIYSVNNSTVTLNNATLNNNYATSTGGGIYNATGASSIMNLNNTIVANSSSGGDCVNLGTINISYSLIEDNTCGIVNGVNGNKTGDPNLGASTGSPAYFPLNAGSIAINAGSNALVPGGVTTDQAGNVRIYNTTVDMGSVEYNSVPPTNTPTSTPTATSTPSVFNPGCSVATLVANVATAGSNGAADTINLPAGCSYILSSTLTINADAGNLLTINGNGATVRGNDTFQVMLVNDGANVIITNTNISNGYTTGNGGGIYSLGNLTLTNSTISGNSAGSIGGGIYSDGNLTLTNSIVSGNTATLYGGGINTTSGTNVLTGSTVRDNNTTSYSGGGISNGGTSTLTLTNSTVSGNTADDYGGGILNNANLALTNSTVSGNSSNGNGGGIWTHGTLTLTNSIVANSANGGDCYHNGGSFAAAFSLIEDGTCGIANGVNGNKTGDPNLGALTGSPAYFPLLTGSIAINAGSNALVPGGITTDQAGNARIQGGTVDMGSFESTPPPTVTYTPTNTPTRTPTRTPTNTPVVGTPTITPPAPNVNLVTNGTFAAGLSGWTFYDSVQNVTNGELVVAPTAPGGGFYQSINYGSGGEIFEVNFRARNSSLTQKTLNIMVRDTDYVPAYNCVFGMTANTPFQYYRMRFDTSEGFIPMILQAAITGDSTLGLVIDDITMVRKTGISVPTTECTVSPPANTELVFNGAFDAGTGSWAAFNATMNSVNIGGANGSIMQIGRNSGTTYGGFYQYSPYSAPANAVFQFSFQIGNQSAQARVINMLVRSQDWTDMHSCFITVPPNTPLTTQTILLKTTKAWSNIVMQGWIQVGDYVSGPPPFRFDNISLQYLPASGFSGSTQCPGPLPMPQRVTDTPSPTITPSLTPSLTATISPTATSTETALPSATATASETPTDVPTVELPSATPEPPTAEPPTITPSEIPTDVPTVEPPTNTPEPSPEVTQSS